MNRFGRIFALAALIALLSACGGGSTFEPNFGPFLGVLLDEAQNPVGSITLTTNQGLVGGTGVIQHSDSQVTVSISGVISGQSISGTISNSLLGSGPFTGQFIDTGECRGNFSYTDTPQLVTTSGTWRADIQ